MKIRKFVLVQIGKIFYQTRGKFVSVFSIVCCCLSLAPINNIPRSFVNVIRNHSYDSCHNRDLNRLS